MARRNHGENILRRILTLRGKRMSQYQEDLQAFELLKKSIVDHR